MTPNNLEFRVATLEKIVAGRFPKTAHARKVHVVETIQSIVADEFTMRLPLLLGKRQIDSLVWPRHIAMALSYEMSGLGTPAIASLFNRLDHSTIVHAINRVKHEESHSKSRAKDVKNIRERVEKALSSV